MSASFGILRVAPFAGFVQRFDDLIGSATTMSLYFIHSRRWRENHDAAIKAFVARAGTTLEVFLPDLENHELMYSLGKHFEDGPLIPALVGDAYRYFARLARDFGKPAHVWLFGRYPTYSFYKFADGAVIALYSNTAAKKELAAPQGRCRGPYHHGEREGIGRRARVARPRENTVTGRAARDGERVRVGRWRGRIPGEGAVIAGRGIAG